MTYRLVIKGGIAEATGAAAWRVHAIYSGQYLARSGQTVLSVDADPREIAQWFGEHDRTPFPAGALLLYGPGDREEVMRMRRARRKLA